MSSGPAHEQADREPDAEHRELAAVCRAVQPVRACPEQWLIAVQDPYWPGAAGARGLGLDVFVPHSAADLGLPGSAGTAQDALDCLLRYRLSSPQSTSRRRCGSSGGLPCPGGPEQPVQVIEQAVRPGHGPAYCHIAVGPKQVDVFRGAEAGPVRAAVLFCDHIYLVLPGAHLWRQVPVGAWA